MSADTPHGEDRRRVQERGWARWALSRWESFPISQQRRPLVMCGPLTRFERGFRSGEGKLAFHYGDIEAVAPLPREMLDVLRANAPHPMPSPKWWSRPLMITQASPDTAEFSTDRGRREFPAWRLGGPEVDGTFWALDPAIAATRWQPPEPAPPKPFDGLPHRAASAVRDRDGRTFHFTFVGAAPEYFEYPSAEVLETRQAIVVLPLERYVGPPGPGRMPAVGYDRTVTVRLARPLGGRVLVDLDASPVTVTQAAWRSSQTGTHQECSRLTCA